MDYTVRGILQARILAWVAFPFSRGSFQPRDRTQVSHIAGGFFNSWATKEALTDLVPISSSSSSRTGFSVVVTESAHKAAAFLHAPFFFFCNFLFSIGADLISDIVFGFGVQELDSVIYRHTSILLSHIDYHSVFNWLPVLFRRSFWSVWYVAVREEGGKRTKRPLFLHVPLFLRTLLITLRPRLPEGKPALGQRFISQPAPVTRANLSVFGLCVSPETRTTERRDDSFWH